MVSLTDLLSEQTATSLEEKNDLPLEESIREMLDILKEFQVPDTQVQRDTLFKLEEILYYPDTNFCLVSILTRLNNQTEDIRLLSGVILKNNIKNFRSNLQYEVLEYIMKECLEALGEPSHRLRQIIASIVSTISSGKKLEYWTQTLQYLCNLIESDDPNKQDGSFATLQMILEDSQEELETTAVLNELLDFILPKLLEYLKHSEARLRLNAIKVTRPIAVKNPPPCHKFMNDLVVNIAFLMNDHEMDIDLHSCRLLASLMMSQSPSVFPVFKPLVSVMLKAYQDTENMDMALAAAEFFLHASVKPEFKESLCSFFQELVPAIMKNICLSGNDELMHLDDDYQEADNEQDIKPSLYDYFTDPTDNENRGQENDAHVHDGASSSTFTCATLAGGKEGYEWTLRNVSIDILSGLSSTCSEQCLLQIPPKINDALCSDNWIYNECGLMALSAIAKGCQEGVKEYLPNLIPLLLNCLRHERIQFRLSACLVVRCYANWLATADRDTVLIPVLTVLMERMRDSNKSVQCNACSAVYSIIEEVDTDFLPYLLPVLQNIEVSFANYQKNNLIFLYKLLKIIADKMKETLNEPTYIVIIMPILTDKWNTLLDNDKELLPLMDCFKSMAKVMKADFLPCCEGIFNKCLRLIENTIDEEVFYINQLTFDKPNKDFKIAPLDLIATIVGVNGERIQALIAKRKILQLLHICTLDTNLAVKNSSFNLLFQLTKVSCAYAQKFAADFFPILATSLDANYPELCVNACKAICELSLQLGTATVDCLDFVLDQFLRLIDEANLDRKILKAILICLGYLGYVCPSELAPYLSYFVNRWFIEVQDMPGVPEKDLAFQGYCFLITLNPQAIVIHFMEFSLAAASLENPSPVLREMINKIWYGFKQEIPSSDWQDFLSKFQAGLMPRLNELYNIQD